MGKTNLNAETAEEEDVESDDSSEEATEEDTEDSESESESDESSEEESEETADEDEESVGKFLDVAKLPKELLPLGKKMQASFTKKAQALKKEYDERQADLSNRYVRALKSEKALEVLSNQESFRMFLTDIREGRPYGYSATFNRNPSKKDEESSSDEDGKVTVESLMKQLVPVIKQVVSTEIEPVLKSHSKMTQAQIKKSLPNYSKYEVEIEELMQNEGLSLERAYQIASQPDRIAEEIAKAVKQGKKDIKRIPRTEGKTSGGSGDLKTKPAKSLREAISVAFSQMGE